MMERLIDADRLKKRSIRMVTNDRHRVFMKAVGTHEIDKQPTVDAVKVVRCKDCWHHNNCGIEQAALAPIGFFCALGERKDDAK